MRLVLAFTALFTATTAVAADESRPAGDMPVLNPNADAPKTCPPISRYEAMKRGGKLAPQTLNQLPSADLYKAVYRRIGGCVVPLIVGYNFGVGGRTRR
ncbi:MAG: hypothetical protein V4502_05540 [Pseudomonadota bacterium]